MPTLNATRTGFLGVTSAHNVYETAREGTGPNVFVNQYPWVGQYRSGNHEINQVFFTFDLTSIPATSVITGAKLVLTISENYGSSTIEARYRRWTPNNTSSFVPGSQLAALPLLGSVTNGLGTREIVIGPTSRTRLSSIILSSAANRTGTPTTGDDTVLIGNATLEVTHETGTVQTVTTVGAGSWTVPANVYGIYGYGHGGGQSAAGGSTSVIPSGQGGDFADAFIPVTPGQVINYNVGNGGASPSWNQWEPAPANPGGNSWLVSTTTMLAKGGGSTATSVGDLVFLGGAGVPTYGGGGSAASKNGNGAAGSTNSTGGGSPGAGAGGAGRMAPPYVGNNGESHPDGGGGGGSIINSQASTGGNGGAPGGGGASGFGLGSGARGGLTWVYRASTVADTTPPVITSTATVSVAENSTLAHSLTADETVSWSIVGGADQARFELSGSTLRWLGNGTKDYEVPDDADGNRVYLVQVRATDTAGNVTNQTINVTVTDVAEDTTPPVITSSASPSVAENTVNPTGSLTANETVTWTKFGGADQALFSLSGSTWTLNATPDYETKTSYVVIWRATDTSGNTTNQTMTLTITDVDETPPVTPVEEVVTYTSNATFTVQPGETSIILAGHAAGGGGAGANPSNSGMGGQGGAFSGATITVAAGDTISIIVGVGGAYGPNNVNNSGGSGQPGGDTQVLRNGTVVLHAQGGLGGFWRATPVDYNDGALNQGVQIGYGVGTNLRSGGAGWCGGQYGTAGAGGGAGSPNGNGVAGSYQTGGRAGTGGAAQTTCPDYYGAMIDGNSHPLGGAGGVGQNNSASTKRFSDGGFPGGGGGGGGWANGRAGSGAGGQVVVTRSIAPVAPTRKAPRDAKIQ